MSNKMSTRDLTEGALMALIALALLVGSYFLPFIGFVLMFAVGVPLSILTVRRSWSVALIASIAAALLTMLLFGPVSGVRFVIMYIPLALVVGMMLSHRRGAGKTLLAAIIIGALSVTLLLIVGAGVAGFSGDMLMSEYNRLIDEMVLMYKNMGVLEQMGLTEEALKQSAQGMLVLLPAMLAIMGGVLGVVHFFLTRATMRKLRLKIPRMPRFDQWFLPSVAIWGFIAAWALWLLADFANLAWLNTLTVNVLVIYGALFFCTGLSVLAHFMRFNQMSSGMKVMVAVFAFFFISGVLILAVLAGLLDLIFDFRKLRKVQAQPRKE